MAKAISIRTAKRSRWRRGPQKRLQLHDVMFVLPNLATLLNLMCGFFAVTSTFVAAVSLQKSALYVFFGIFFDMLDGRIARLTKTQSDFGMQIDSLADMVTFGFAPAFLAYVAFFAEYGTLGRIFCFVYVACGAIRLARFNVLASQELVGSKKYFIGLPIPLAAATLCSLVMLGNSLDRFGQFLGEKTSFLAAMLLGLSFLMISNVHYRSFKEAKLTPRTWQTLAALALLLFGASFWLQASHTLLIGFGLYIVSGPIEEGIRHMRHFDEDAKPTQ